MKMFDGNINFDIPLGNQMDFLYLRVIEEISEISLLYLFFFCPKLEYDNLYTLKNTTVIINNDWEFIVESINTTFEEINNQYICWISGANQLVKKNKTIVYKIFKDQPIIDIIEGLLEENIIDNNVVVSNPSIDNILSIKFQYGKTNWEFVKNILSEYGLWICDNRVDFKLFNDNSLLDIIEDVDPIFHNNLVIPYRQINNYDNCQKIMAINVDSGVNIVYNSQNDLLNFNEYHYCLNNIGIDVNNIFTSLSQQNDKINFVSTNNMVMTNKLFSYKERMYAIQKVIHCFAFKPITPIVKNIIHNIIGWNGSGLKYMNIITAYCGDKIFLGKNMDTKINNNCIITANICEGDYFDRENNKVLVEFPWITDNKEYKTCFVPIMMPFSSNGKGIQVSPEPNNRAIIQFLNNNVDYPIVIGFMYNDQNISPNLSEETDVFLGNSLSSKIEINNNGSLSIYGEKKINNSVLSGDYNINADSGDMKVDCGKVISLKAIEKIELNTDGIMEFNSNEMKIDSKLLTINADEININGKLTNITGDITNIKGTELLELNSNITFVIKGAIINIEGVPGATPFMPI